MHCDQDWLLQVGVVCIMDKLIEHLEFTSGINRIRHAAFVGGEESGRARLKAYIDYGAHDPEGSDSRSNHTMSLNDVLIDFSKMVRAAIMGWVILIWLGYGSFVFWTMHVRLRMMF